MANTVEITVNAKDNASHVFRGIARNLQNIAYVAGRGLRGLSASATNLGGILTGGLTTGVHALGGAFTALSVGVAAAGTAFGVAGKFALDATMEYERMSMTLESLIAREIRSEDQTLSMAQALNQAAPAAQNLLQWTQELALNSPFDQTTIANSFQQAMVFGFTADEAQRLTQVLVDMSAGMGLTSDQMGGVAYALGQINSADKLLMQDLRQLMARGVPVNDILQEMGYSMSDLGEETIDTQAFVETFMSMMERDFGGAAEKTTESWSGLMNALGDLKKLGLRELFSGIFEQFQPMVKGFVDWLSGDGLVTLRGWGDSLGSILGALMSMDTGKISKAFAELFGVDTMGEALAWMDGTFFSQKFSEAVDGVNWQALSQGIAAKINAVDWNAVGMSIRDNIRNILQGLTTIIQEVDWAALAGSIKNALLGIITPIWTWLTNTMLLLFSLIWNDITSVASTKMTELNNIVVNTLTDLANNFWAKMSELKNIVVNTLSDLTNNWREGAGKWIEAAAQGILASAGKIIDALKKIVAQALAAIEIVIPVSVGGGGGSTGGGSGSGGGGSSGGGGGNRPSSGAFHSGGIARGPASGHTALLHGTEGVFTREQMAYLSPAGAGGIVVNLTYAPAVSLASEEEMQRHLTPVILRAIKQAQRGR